MVSCAQWTVYNARQLCSWAFCSDSYNLFAFVSGSQCYKFCRTVIALIFCKSTGFSSVKWRGHLVQFFVDIGCLLKLPLAIFSTKKKKPCSAIKKHFFNWNSGWLHSFLILVLKIRTSCMSEFRHIVIILVLSNFFYLSTKTFQRSKKLTVVKFSHIGGQILR